MHRREFPAVLFSAIFAFLLVWAIFPPPACAQAASPTPESPTPVGTQPLIPEIPTPSPVLITYPVHGLRLTGVIKITATIALQGWTSYELAFSYANDATGTWFGFAGGTNPLPADGLAAWDTTRLSDGDYNLRLRVFSPGGSQDGFAYGLRVRNYTVDTPEPTLTPTPTATPLASATPVSTAVPSSTTTLTPTAYPTPTALPANPAALGAGEIVFNLVRGALLIFFLFGAFGLYLRLRHR